ncbi:hypothetical protein HYH03_012328 [Edaphochlamys debaryana]|uniref:HD domain-containing protein n=1 Tax=Edaphochlamys debaryana TaxID=47281 RepID=A0A836BUI5_9CHLO|nr:hypothetical protein HYH03_012328 [Edaphochlamys debaryana]|eukprot:KAG2489102.1 hypothetical protein HYH03_012328 [Edaphochlamys debaryana]
MDDDDNVIFSQEAMRAQDLLYGGHNFGSEPQHTQYAFSAAAGGAGPSGQNGGRQERSPGSPGFQGAGGTAAGPPRRHGKIFSDPVHGTFRLDPINVAVVDTPQFQRLRDLHQLGLTHLIFPSAVHTRFEHSLGTSYKAFEVAERIFRTQGGDLGMDKYDIMLASLAGLTHDLGHGPFSHVFENEFLRQKGIEWHHESMSTRILEYLVDDNHIEGITQEHRQKVEQLIKGDVHEDRGFLFDIVNNKRCGIDVDKIDYLQRDALMCDVNIGCDFKRLLMMTKVIDNQIAYKWSEYGNLWDLFHARESMHRKVYTHRKTKAVEFMVVDALLEADQALHFSENIHTPEDFCTLNDSLLNTIESYGKMRGRMYAPLEDDAAACILRAQEIVGRLRRRDLYRFAQQFTVPTDYLEDGRWESIGRRFTAAEVASCAPSDGGVRLEPHHLVLNSTKIDFTQGGSNPLDSVLFFDTTDDVVGHRIVANQVVGILPRYHQDRILRVYTRVSDPAYQVAAGRALEAWCRRHFGQNAVMATPAKRAPSGAGAAAGAREAVMAEADPRRAAARPPTGLGGRSGSQGSGSGILAATLTALGSAAGAGPRSTAAGGGGPEATLGGGAGVGGSGGGGTPTRSTPVTAGTAAAAAAAAEQQAAAEEGGAGAAAAADEQQPRSKRPRSSASLFHDA